MTSALLTRFEHSSTNPYGADGRAVPPTPDPLEKAQQLPDMKLQILEILVETLTSQTMPNVIKMLTNIEEVQLYFPEEAIATRPLSEAEEVYTELSSVEKIAFMSRKLKDQIASNRVLAQLLLITLRTCILQGAIGGPLGSIHIPETLRTDLASFFEKLLESQ